MISKNPRKGYYSLLLVLLILIGLAGYAAAVSGSDVIGTRMTIESELIAGSPAELQDIIRNQGRENTGEFEVHYYLTLDPESTDNLIPVGKWVISGLKAGAQKTGKVTIGIPLTTTAGSYYLVRSIDPAESLINEDRSNNIQRSKGPITLRSRTGSGARGIGTLAPGSATAGEQIEVTVMVEGDSTSQNDSMDMYLFLSSTEFPDGYVTDIGTLRIPTVEAGREAEVTEQLLVPGTISPGNYYLFTSFLPPGEINIGTDSSFFWYNENPLQIQSATSAEPEIVPDYLSPSLIRGTEPDIVGKETRSPDEVYIGDSMQITDSVLNIGGSTASIVRIEYLLSPNSDGTNGRHLGWWTLQSLQPDEIRSSDITLGVPSSMRPGLQYLTKQITVTSNPGEKNTANNKWVSNEPLSVRYSPYEEIPDLTHVKTIWPCGQPGAEVQITDKVTNIGNSCAEGVSVVYYVSPYNQFDAATAEYLGVWQIDSICVGEQKQNTITVKIPEDLTNGEYYFYSIINPCAYIESCGEGDPELDLSNNINQGTLYIGPCVFCGC
ncbi:MAG TPA: CARDB domain-containing protein [Methanospirillum sp.]|nr:CARDB domain-containing protein [Methanospirillum sp.]